MKHINIKGRMIGDGYPAYIIAEMSANHSGSIERAKEIIREAKRCGADCVKIQTYTPDTLTIDCNNEYFNIDSGTWEGENLYSLYGKAYTPWEWQQELKEEADRIGIDFFSTPFDKTSVDFLEEMGVEFYKIASFEMVDLPLLKYVASKGKPIIMSTGMANLEEIEEAVEAIYEEGNTQLALLKCSSAYPAIPNDMHLKTIVDMKERFDIPIGLSDHSMGHVGAATAVAMGANIIEKHFCMSREIENPDASFSMNPEEFKEMVDTIRQVEKAKGEVFYGVSSQEENSVTFRRSIFAVKDIKKGEVFTEENVRIIRPGYGIKPKYMPNILGEEAVRDIERGTPMKFDLINKRFKRVFVVVIDSLGVGALADAAEYGDVGTDTLGHIAERTEGFKIPNLQKLGMANLHSLKDVEAVDSPLGYYTKLREASVGKDTMTGHWEMMGLHITKPFKTFTETGFPKELLDELSQRTGRVIIGNKSASGTEILDELAEEEIATGHMIVYTSADSVLQICGNEETFGLDELYRCCEIAREITMKDEWKVGRIIARPYVGKKKGEFKRTSNRHDYALKPYGKTTLDALKSAGYDVISVGKISDIFDGEGITESNKSKSSVHGMEQTIEIAQRDFEGLCFVNLVDFDALWGHRRDVAGYAKELEMFDEKLGELLPHIGEEDLLIITADHGNDPTHTGTDHTREKVPFLAYSSSLKGNGALEEADTFAVIGATIADNFKVPMPKGTIGKSILNSLS